MSLVAFQSLQQEQLQAKIAQIVKTTNQTQIQITFFETLSFKVISPEVQKILNRPHPRHCSLQVLPLLSYDACLKAIH